MLQVTMRSANKKVGPIPQTYRTEDSCPNSCTFKRNGCYAMFGTFGNSPFRIAEKWGKPEEETLARIATEAKSGVMIRHHVSGDLVAADGVTPDAQYIENLKAYADQRPDLRNYTYTHAWRELGENPFASVKNFLLNASCETQEDIEQAASLGYQTVVAVSGESDDLIGQYIAGRKVIVCPEQTGQVKDCASCGLCAVTRKSTVAFLAHGAGSMKIQKGIAKRKAE